MEQSRDLHRGRRNSDVTARKIEEGDGRSGSFSPLPLRRLSECFCRRTKRRRGKGANNGCEQAQQDVRPASHL